MPSLTDLCRLEYLSVFPDGEQKPVQVKAFSILVVNSVQKDERSLAMGSQRGSPENRGELDSMLMFFAEPRGLFENVVVKVRPI